MDAASTDNPVPVTLDVASLRSAPVKIVGSRVELPILVEGVTRLTLVADGNHKETRFGLRQLMDAISQLQFEVMSQELTEERAARIAAAAEPITITVSEASVKDLPPHLEATAGNSGPGGQ